MTASEKASPERSSATPRAVIHKNILDAADEDPDASLEALADDVTGATVNVVAKVLEEYGDPAEQAAPSANEEPTEQGMRQGHDSEHTMTESNGHREQFSIEWADLTDKQRETLRTIREHPEATQADLAELLGVTSATINTRVNSIEGFDWEQRHEFIDRVQDEIVVTDTGEEKRAESVSMNDAASDQQKLRQRVQTLEERVRQLDDESTNRYQCSISVDPELAHKVLHACLHSDSIDEEEELAIVREFVT